MATKSKLRTFNVTGRLILIVDTQVEADSFEGAVIKANELKEVDFIDFPDDNSFNDGSLKITGISLSDAWDTEQ